MADERTDLIKRLAPLVLEDRSRAAADKRSTDIPWYFININHPAMRPFYNSWLQSRGRLFLPGDIDRAEFELSLLSNKSLDCDVCYRDYPAIMEKNGLNGYTKTAQAAQPKATEYMVTAGPMSAGDKNTIKAQAEALGLPVTVKEC